MCNRIGFGQEEWLDLTKTDEQNHKLLAKFALKKVRSNSGNTATNPKSVRVSSVIVEIETKPDSMTLDKLQDEIFKITKYGLYWGAGSVTPENKLLVSFAAEENRSYGVGSVIEEIQDGFPDQVKLAYVKSYKDDITIHL